MLIIKRACAGSDAGQDGEAVLASLPMPQRV
jgi:hypothetical protein